MDDPGEARFGKWWAEWDRRVAAGERTASILQAAKDEDLIELLAGESPHDRKYARDIIATELLNRLRSRGRALHSGTTGVERSARTAHEAAQKGQQAIHHAEGILKAEGQEELGTAVSASADASLHATEAAFDSAKAQATALHTTLAQSRLGGGLAEEAAEKAEEGREITRKLEETMSRFGHGEEGRAASDAARSIQRATTQAAEDSAKHQEKARASRVHADDEAEET